MKTWTCFVLLGMVAFAGASGGAAAQTIASGTATLSFPAAGDGSRGMAIHSTAAGASDVGSARPVQMFVCSSCSDEMKDEAAFGVGYRSVTASGDGVVALARVTSPNGSAFEVRDVYRAGETAGGTPGTFTVERTVTVAEASGKDKGFNSQFVVGFAKPLPIGQYHFFAPAIWYDKNADAADKALAKDMSNQYFYWRETRTSLPMVMMQDPGTKTVLSIAHIQSTPHSGANEEDGQWLVDPTVQYGSIGAQRVPAAMLGFIYPAEEGDGTYVGNRNRMWTKRSHPVVKGFEQTYTLMIGLGQAAEYSAALAQTWRLYYRVFDPPVADIPMDAVYRDEIGVLNHYSADRGGAQGWPFNVNLPGGDVYKVSYQMGFVGEQIPLGFQLVRDGVLHGDETSLANGKATLDFWAKRSEQASGLPYVWYDVTGSHFRDAGCGSVIFLRTVTDGMEGMVNAAMLMREHKMAQPLWEGYVRRFSDWLVAHQNTDGSFYRAFSPDGNVFNSTGCPKNDYAESKMSSTHPVRFLVTMYFATGDERYLKAAVAAGNFAMATVYGPGRYVGGVVDNPNTIDKESGNEGIRAALALYDATHEAKWLDAARKAGDFTETWEYVQNFGIRGAPAAYVHAGTQGSSFIATGQSAADVELASEAYDFYRLHLFGDDADNHYLKFAEMLEYNTKLPMQVTGMPGQLYGYALDGLVSEAISLSNMEFMGGKSSAQWLPWLTDAEMEPLQKLEDTFGSMSIRELEKQPVEELKKKNLNVYPAAGSLGWPK